MNLADIRKKAEESRRAAAATSVETVNESAQLPALDVPEPVAIDEPILAQAELPTEDFTEEFFNSAGQVMKADPGEADSTPAVICPDEQISAPAPIPDADTAGSEAICQPQPAIIVAKKSTVYNPLETILAGRESAAAAEDNALSRITTSS